MNCNEFCDRHRTSSLIRDLLILLGGWTLVVVNLLISNFLRYWAGRRGFNVISFPFDLGTALLGPGLAVYMLARLWRFRKQRRVLGPLVRLAIAVFFFVVPWRIVEPRCAPFSRGFRYEMRETVDPDQLQLWAMELIEETKEKKKPNFMRRKELPSFVQSIWGSGPKRTFVGTASSTDQPVIFLDWGGGRWNCVLVIGGPDFKISSESDPCVVKWVDGIYCFSGP